MRRREFIALIGGAAAAWPLAARAQSAGRMRRVGIVMPYPKGDVEYESRAHALRQEIAKLGWTEGSNIQFDERWTTDDMSRVWADAASLMASNPDVVVATGGRVVPLLMQLSRSVPIVVSGISDPVGIGWVKSLARPGGNVTGFTPFEYGMAAKWLELLKEIAPGVTRAAVLRDPALSTGIGQFGAIQSVAPSLSVEVSAINVRDAGEIERAVAGFARLSSGGLILTGSAFALVHRDLIITLSAQHKLPTVYPWRIYATNGGLISYGPDFNDQNRQAASYVDRILKGEKPADLPVQAPTKYELVINLKTAKALGLDVPPTLLARADEVIE
jgi:putative ABC transport system substrate-binding protein